MDHDTARDLLIEYFHGTNGTRAYSGARFDTFGSNPPDRVVSDDLIAVSLLNGRIRQHGPIRLLETDADKISEALAGIRTDLDLHEIAERAEIGPGSAGWKLWNLLREGGEGSGLGRVATSKVLARKRPRLFPIWDRRIGRYWGLENPSRHWEVVRSFLRAEPNLIGFLRQVGEAANIPEGTSVLRTLDVLLWMTQADRVD